MDKNSELINQILTDLKNDENVDINNLPQPISQQEEIPPQFSQPTQELPSPEQMFAPTEQLKPPVIESKSESLLNRYKGHISYIKNFILFLVIFIILSLPQINSVIVEFVPEDININILLLIKGVIGGVIFLICDYFFSKNVADNL